MPASTLLDSVLYRDALTSPDMRAIWSDEAQLRTYVEVEVALARAQGETGIIPAEAAAAIAENALRVALDIERLKASTHTVGYPIAGLVVQLSSELGAWGRYVHWGATTQDIMDTATVLQARRALALIEGRLGSLADALARLAARHRDTPMAGRTHLQQALPTTFGHKAAVWLSSLQRIAARLDRAKPHALMAQLGGATGTLASLGDRGLDVRAAFARHLGLNEPDITWHVARDGLVELAQALATLCGALGKIGFDVMLLMATEIGEVSEPFASHRGASSTMPQKRNPISSEILLASARMARDAASLMLDAMVQDLERATGPWHAEWLALPQTFLVASGALQHAQLIADGLIVDTARMRRNLDLTSGLVMAEAVMMGLAPRIGRQTAHDEVYAACRDALENGGQLIDALLRRPAVAAALDRGQIAALCEPTGYLGTAGAMVDRVLARQAGSGAQGPQGSTPGQQDEDA
jgi:3-carboxy-cis,cis-muconate cycloisomerase